MSFTSGLVIFTVGTAYLSIILVGFVSTRGIDDDMEEWNQVCPGLDFPVKCPEKGEHYAKIYYEQDFLDIPNIVQVKEPLADRGIYLMRNVSLNDTNDFVCVYEEKDILPYTIHVTIIPDPYDFLEHTKIFHPGPPLPTPSFSGFTIVEMNDHLRISAIRRKTRREEIVRLEEGDNQFETDHSKDIVDQEYPEELKNVKLRGGDFGDYNVQPSVNTTGLVPPSLPKVTRIPPSRVEISWKIQLNRGSPVSHYIVQHLKSLSTHGVGGGNWWMDSKAISPSTKYCTLQLEPKYYYRFRVAAVFRNKLEEIKVFGNRSDWLKL